MGTSKYFHPIVYEFALQCRCHRVMAIIPAKPPTAALLPPFAFAPVLAYRVIKTEML